MEITGELIQECIDKYITEHEKEILADIDHRVAKAVEKAVREYFTSYNWNKTPVQKYTGKRVEDLAQEEAEKVEIDVDKITSQVTKKVQQQINKISVTIGG